MRMTHRRAQTRSVHRERVSTRTHTTRIGQGAFFLPWAPPKSRYYWLPAHRPSIRHHPSHRSHPSFLLQTTQIKRRYQSWCMMVTLWGPLGTFYDGAWAYLGVAWGMDGCCEGRCIRRCDRWIFFYTQNPSIAHVTNCLRVSSIAIERKRHGSLWKMPLSKELRASTHLFSRSHAFHYPYHPYFICH